MIFLLLFFGGIAYVHYSLKNQGTPASSLGKAKPQPLSYQAAQGFAQGNEFSARFRKRGEGNRVIAQGQKKIVKGSQSAGTDRVRADLLDRVAKTFDPQWRMRYMNAYHRMTLQSDVDNGREPRAALNVDRTAEEVNNDTGQTSGFTRTQITYQQRFSRGLARNGAGPNPARPLDQEDPGDQTSLQHVLKPNGWKSVIYPFATEDRNGHKHAWPGLKVRDLEKEYWSRGGKQLNTGYTFQDMPAHKGWLWALFSPARNRQGSYPVDKGLPERSNIASDQVESGKG